MGRVEGKGYELVGGIVGLVIGETVWGEALGKVLNVGMGGRGKGGVVVRMHAEEGHDGVGVGVGRGAPKGGLWQGGHDRGNSTEERVGEGAYG